MPFISKAEHDRLLAFELDNKSQSREHTKAVKELKRDHTKELHTALEKNEELDHSLKLVSADLEAYKKRNDDATANKSKDLELKDREAAIKRREDNCGKREKALDEEESAHYKSGYQDGVADGLRKGYELTADDRQNMASIAALAAASHSDGATQKIAEQIVMGMENNRANKQLASGSKKKS